METLLIAALAFVIGMALLASAFRVLILVPAIVVMAPSVYLLTGSWLMVALCIALLEFGYVAEALLEAFFPNRPALIAGEEQNGKTQRTRDRST